MYERSDALASYGRIANSQDDPLQQVVMLYDGAIKFLRLTATAIESGDLSKKAEHVNRALDILNYLQGILDFKTGGSVAHTLDKLYTVVSMKVLRASATLDAKAMLAAADLLVPVRDSWVTIASKAAPTIPSLREVSAAEARPRLTQPVVA
jgi:flagellar secretion chaperone FliS